MKRWIYAGIVSLIGAGLSGLVTWTTMPANATTREIIVSCLIPAAFIFYSWLKDNPPAWNGQERRNSPVVPPKVNP